MRFRGLLLGLALALLPVGVEALNRWTLIQRARRGT